MPGLPAARNAAVPPVPAGGHDRVRDRRRGSRGGVPGAAGARVRPVPVHGRNLGADAGTAPLRAADHAGRPAGKHRAGRRSSIQGTRSDPDHGACELSPLRRSAGPRSDREPGAGGKSGHSHSESPACSGRRRGSTSWPIRRPPTPFAKSPGGSTAASTVSPSVRSSTPSRGRSSASPTRSPPAARGADAHHASAPPLGRAGVRARLRSDPRQRPRHGARERPRRPSEPRSEAEAIA